jgi:2,3-bisphosphoglycerate-independent phosphoglycerate mutase
MSSISKKTVILIVLDGWGYSENTEFNAIHAANKPSWDRLWAEFPHTLISASGIDVGLPDRQMGNSEVGHMNIGSGRVIDQDFTRITRAIDDGSFFSNQALCKTFEDTAKSGKAVHILGLLSPGGVHSHQNHVFALMKLAEKYGNSEIYLHAFLDGRDTAPNSASEFLQETEDTIKQINNCRLASVIGRFYAMDRNQNWDRIQLAYDLITQGLSEYQCKNSKEAIEMAYARGESDEFVMPTAIVDEKGTAVSIKEGDAIVFANYRADRARQLTLAFTKTDFNSFPRAVFHDESCFVSMTEYKADFDFPVAFPPMKHKNVFGEYIADLGLRQLRIAETEKYAHVTFFFNGGEEKVFANEDRILVPSPHVNTYDEQPEMNADQVADKMVEAIKSRQYDAIICNFANADMVGHTGDFDAAVKAVETLDQCLQSIVDASNSNDAELLITADHGNAEQMRELNSNPAQAHTAHTNNLVPLVYVGRPATLANEEAALCDLAPTMLHLMGLEKPDEMTGNTIFQLENED